MELQNETFFNNHLDKIPAEVQEILNQFSLNLDQYGDIMQLLEIEMDKGLCPETTSDVKMYPSYVTKLPTGKEEGQYLALDLGGTNYRVLLVTFSVPEQPKIDETTYAIPQEKMSGNGKELFEYIAQTLAEFLKMHKIVSWPLKLGFSFSFPCQQKTLNNATLVRWTKGFSVSGCEGEDIAILLQGAINTLNLQVECVAVVNDAVGTLTACALQNSNCAIGVIIGTGTNAAYIEKIERVKTFEGSTENIDHVVINMEWGAFAENGSLNGFRTEFDELLDQQSLHPKQQIFEKMTSGMYLGELVRLILLDLIKKNYLFRGIVPISFPEKGYFETRYLSEVEKDPLQQFHSTSDLLNVHFDVTDLSHVDSIIVRAVCEKVATRASYLIGTGIACLINRINNEEVTVGIDGSLFKRHPKFPEWITSIIDQLKHPDIKFSLKLSEDGSGKGAAIIAASAI